MKSMNILFGAFLVLSVVGCMWFGPIILALAALICWTILKKQENTRLAEELEMAIDQHTRAQESYEEAVALVKNLAEVHNSANEITKTRFTAIEEQLQNIKVGNTLKFGGK